MANKKTEVRTASKKSTAKASSKTSSAAKKTTGAKSQKPSRTGPSKRPVQKVVGKSKAVQVSSAKYHSTASKSRQSEIGLVPELTSGDLPIKADTLQINHISKLYSKKKVVDNVSFEVSQGEVVGLLGPNGAGKTTSFYIAVGLVSPNGGRVMFDQVDITSYPMYKRSSLGIGYLPQEPSVFRKLSVYDNVMCILEARGYPKIKRKERVQEILEELKVSHVATQYGYTLSGGERRRVEIARTLACDPKIILLDEPFAGVDPIAVIDIQTEIKQIQKMKIGILITDHNVRETLKIVSRAYIMSEGKVILKGTASQLVRSKKAREIYLGEDFQL